MGHKHILPVLWWAHGSNFGGRTMSQRELVALADHIKRLFSGRCDHCGSHEVSWVGHSKRVGNPTWRNSDIEQCQDCGRAWYFAKSGRRMGIRAYRVWKPVAVS